MAKQINARNITRGNVFHIPPEELIIVEGANSRRYAVKADPDLALDILDRGQLVPVIIRRDDSSRPVVVDGHRRVAAIRYVNDEKLYEAAGLSSPLKVRCEPLDDYDDKDALITSLKSNIERLGTTAIDDAHNIARLERSGVSRAEISRLYRRSAAWVTQTAKLASLPARVQKQVHEGKIAVSTGYDLSDLPEDQIDEALGKASTAKPGEVTREAVRKARSPRAGEKDSEEPGVKPRTLKQIRMFFINLDNVVGDGRGPIEEFAGDFLKFMAGELTDRQFENRLRKIQADR